MAVLAFLGAAAPSIIMALVGGGVAGGVVFALLAAGRRRGSWPLALVAGIVVAILLFGGVGLAQAYTPVEYGTVALVQRFGGLTGEVFEPGLHWRAPFIDQVVVVPTVVLSYEASEDPNQSNADYRDYPVDAQTIDGQQVHIKYTVLFRVPASDAVNIVQNIGMMNEVVKNMVKAHSRNLARLWAQGHPAEDLYSGDGVFIYQAQVRDALEAELAAYGIILDDFLVRKIDFDASYIEAIEQQQIAQEAIQTAQYNAEAAEYEKQQQIRLAEAEAERTRLMAQADADRQRLLADSEAYSIEARGMALREYPEVIQWEFVRNLQDIQWGILPADGITPLVPIPEFESGPSLPIISGE